MPLEGEEEFLKEVTEKESLKEFMARLYLYHFCFEITVKENDDFFLYEMNEIKA